MAGHLPLSEPVFHILLALTDDPRHGYGILLEVDRRTNGGMTLGIGTLYSAIKRLRERSLMREVDAPGDVPEDSRRRYYELTSLGRAVAEAEARRLESLVLHAREKSVLPTPEATPTQAG